MKNHISDVAEIMGVDEDIVWVLPKIKYPNNMLSGTCEFFYLALQKLNLISGKTVLDIPCGMGGVSVYLAREYGATIYGYDVMAGFIENANDYAIKNNVNHLCHFDVEDIRNVINKNIEYDALIWSSPPHIWENYKETILNLRKCVKHNGYIFISDSWVNAEEHKNIYQNYDMREEMLNYVTAYGDTIIYYTEEDGEDIFNDGYEFERKAVINAINDTHDPAEKKALNKILVSMDKWDETDDELMGGCYMVLQVNKAR
jgi:SAM-dependent methyltransferase